MNHTETIERKIDLLKQAVDIVKMEIEYKKAAIRGYEARITHLEEDLLKYGSSSPS